MGLWTVVRKTGEVKEKDAPGINIDTLPEM